MTGGAGEINYIPPGPESDRFLRDSSASGMVDLIMGPPGSGKTTAALFRILLAAQQQRPNPRDGIRYSSFGVFRVTNREIEENLLPTWHEWFPAQKGEFTKGPPATHHLRRQMGRDVFVDVKVSFAQLNLENYKGLLRGLPLSGVFVNEADLMPEEIFNYIQTRWGRYPGPNLGGNSWFGMWADTNSFDEDHYLARDFVYEPKSNYRFYKQPGGLVKDPGGRWVLNPEAENLANLRPGYYESMIPQMTDYRIAAHVENRISMSRAGEPVYPEYDDDVHCTVHALAPVRGVPISLGGDAGRTASVVIGQELPDGQLIVLDELVHDGMGGAQIFGQRLRRLLQSDRYAGMEIVGAFGDPSAAHKRNDTDDRTWLGVMTEQSGVRWDPAPGNNDPTTRTEVVRKQLLANLGPKKPGLVISPNCRMLRRGFLSGYRYRKYVQGAVERVDDKPDKNEFSHVHDALQYWCLGLGLERELYGYGHNSLASRRAAQQHWPTTAITHDGEVPRQRRASPGVLVL